MGGGRVGSHPTGKGPKEKPALSNTQLGSGLEIQTIKVRVLSLFSLLVICPVVVIEDRIFHLASLKNP